MINLNKVYDTICFSGGGIHGIMCIGALYYLENNKTHSLGFVAQQVREHIPEVVKMRDNGFYYILYPQLNAYLVEGIKEHQNNIASVDERLTMLEEYIENY